ncbi:MAG: hypothetical protein AAGF90_02585 [Pseudomonadota bacterium]
MSAAPLAGRIAVIGWGSLIWDLDDLAPKVDGRWLMGAGPRLPFEFSRISPKRKLALAVCLDPDNGDACATNAIVSRRRSMEEAVEDLRARERAPAAAMIGAATAAGPLRARLPEVGEALAAWCRATGAAGAVWTDLESNFEERTGGAFSVRRGVDYLRTLGGESLDEAVAYLENAPAATMTPLRRALAADPWWIAAAGARRHTEN